MSGQQFERFGKYLLLEKLATGGMAEVFLARSAGTSGIAKFLAIKRILPQYAESQEFIDMFKDEAKIAINLSHSNIVSILEFGVQNLQFFIVMDYVEGRNLRQILNKMKKSNAQFSIDQIAYIVKEVAAGLDHAHRCLDANTGKPLNITHRDMSPQNVMISFEGEVKIVDFGIAKAESQIETTRAGTLKGKFGYMSPEQADGQPIDLRTDIFSLGIVLWELLANDRLFSANNELNTLRKIRDCQIPPLRKINPNIHAELERITQKALARDRNLRYQTAAAFHRDLNRFLNRQYPDFSPQDFSVFIKSIFAEDIMNLRKRLMDYSKLSSSGQSSSSVDERTAVVDTQTNSMVVTQTGPQGFSLNTPASSSNTTSASKTGTSENPATAFSTNPSGANVLDEASLTREAQRKIEVKPQLEYKLETEETTSPSIRQHTNVSRVARYTQPRYMPRPQQQQSVRVTSIALFLAAVLGIYSYLVKFHTRAMLPVIQLTQPYLKSLHSMLGINETAVMPVKPQPMPAPPTQASPQPPVSETAMASQTPEAYIVISSQPSGAEIYIDHRDTGLITPSRVSIPPERPFSLQLKRLGYLAFGRTNVTAQQLGGHFTASLQEAQVAFLDIDLIPPKDARLFVNGQLVHERPPYRDLPVPANSPVRLKVDDGQGNTDERTVQLSRNQHRRITLNLHNRAAE